ncbi:Uncharacterised protein [Salmonella enterica subsp. enterica serovar Typhi]|nr:Uncharacterised protein [Salmonella enterica subsp. enterica serovar Typhi]
MLSTTRFCPRVRRVLELDNGKLVRTLLTFLVIDTSS